MSIQAIKEERAGLVAQMRGILDKADTEKRALSAEERQEYDRIEADVDAKAGEIDALEGDLRRKAKADDLFASLKTSPGAKTNASGGNAAAPAGTSIIGTDGAKAEAAQAFRKYLVGGEKRLSNKEMAALQVDIDAAGGTLVVPEQFLAELIKGVDNLVFMRQLGRVIRMGNAESLGIPSLDADPADADWTSELETGGEDSTMATGKRVLHPQPLAKKIKVSRDLLRQSAISAEGLIRDRLGFKFGVAEERAFLNGTGSNQPLGVFTASSNGISTGRDISTGNSSTAISADGLINCKFNLKAQYMMSSSLRWVFSREAVRDIRKLKDGNGQYLWTAGLAGTPDRILEVPYVMSEYAPNTFTSGLYVGIIGDFSNYWIAEQMGMEMQRLDELYAATNQVGFFGRMKLDGMPVLEEAFSRVKLG